MKIFLAKPRIPNLNFVTMNAMIMTESIMCTVLTRMRPEVTPIFIVSTY